MANERSESIKAPQAVVAWAHQLFEITTKKSGRQVRRCTLLFPKNATDMAPLNRIVAEAAEKAWPGKAAKLAESGVLKNPILDGDGPQGVNKKTGERYAGYAGHWFIRVESGVEHPVAIVDGNMLPILDKSGLKSGDHVTPVVHAYSWTSEEQPYGVSFGISAMQLIRRGEALGGGGGGAAVDPGAYFEKIADEGEAPAETKSGKGAAGLFG